MATLRTALGASAVVDRHRSTQAQGSGRCCCCSCPCRHTCVSMCVSVHVYVCVCVCVSQCVCVYVHVYARPIFSTCQTGRVGADSIDPLAGYVHGPRAWAGLFKDGYFNLRRTDPRGPRGTREMTMVPLEVQAL